MSNDAIESDFNVEEFRSFAVEVSGRFACCPLGRLS